MTYSNEIKDILSTYFQDHFFTENVIVDAYYPHHEGHLKQRLATNRETLDFYCHDCEEHMCLVADRGKFKKVPFTPLPITGTNQWRTTS